MQAIEVGRAMLRSLRGGLIAVLLVAASPASYGWSDHASLVWPLLRTMPAMLDTPVQPESLQSFITAESAGLASLLDEQEYWARANVPQYPIRPDALRFDPGADDLRRAFLEAIRVNPTLPYRLYRQTTVEDDEVPATLRFSDLSFLGVSSSHRDVTYVDLAERDGVLPAHVLASGSDEPDFGMDIGLYSDNGTVEGARFGFGTQPFGNPNLDYGSQAPFHMGFYHLDWLTEKAQPDLLRTLPEWRIALYRALAHYAFKTGHEYWGWRFMGWALHYVGDLTQPYHAQPLPGVSTVEALWLVATGKTNEAIQLVSNRHGVLESYQYHRVMRAMRQQDWDDPVLAAIASARDVDTFGDATVRDLLTRESTDLGAQLDEVLEENMPERFVSDPSFEWTGSGEETAILETVAREKGSAAVQALDREVEAHMRRFSYYAKMWVQDGLQAERPK